VRIDLETPQLKKKELRRRLDFVGEREHRPSVNDFVETSEYTAIWIMGIKCLGMQLVARIYILDDACECPP
jgi:hypothetical protein